MYQVQSPHLLSMKGGPWLLATVTATAVAAVAAEVFWGWHPAGCRLYNARELDVEADVQHVPVLDQVVLPLEALLAPIHDLGPRAGLHEVIPADHLAADEPACDVGVDGRGRIERGLPSAQRPGAGVVFRGGEERDQIDGLEQPPGDLAEGPRFAFPERCSLLLGQLRELGLELCIQAARAVANLDQGLRRQRLES